MQNMINKLRRELRALADTHRAAAMQRSYKTGPGEYGEGDRFLGLSVPQVRRIAAGFCDLPLPAACLLLRSPFHEERLCALVVLIRQFKSGNPRQRTAIYQTYLAHTGFVNNWDLVDLSAGQIVGAYLDGRSRAPLRRLAASRHLWERRIAMVATSYAIGKGDPDPALEIAERLVDDEHDLIQKAVGWMLREIGKRCSRDAERAFLNRHAASMPRTALRYALEHFSREERTRYLRLRLAQTPSVE